MDLTLTVKTWAMRQSYTVLNKKLIRHTLGRLVRPSNPSQAYQEGQALIEHPYRVLAITAHPDDLEFFAGGTIKRMINSGSQITALVLTDGEKRGNKQDLGKIRRKEMLLAANKQGMSEVIFAGLTDFGLPEEPAVEQVIAKTWKQVNPQIVLGFDPLELIPGMANRDHKALGRTLMDMARSKVYDHVRIYFYGTRYPNVLVNIDPVIEHKIELVNSHESQLLYLKRNQYRQLIRYYGEIYAQYAPCRYAEGLYRLL